MTKLELEHIAKIEGHAKLYIKVEGGKIETVELRVMEGSRFFEGILRDRKYNDISHIASRICGVCSVVHAITSTKAIESALGIQVSEQTRILREVLNIGGIIQSHALHLYFLTLPDYAGVDSVLALAKTHKATFDRALRLKRLGNMIVKTMAGRDVHPIACVLGGFSRIPSKESIESLVEELKRCKEDAVETVNLFLSLKYPEFKKQTKMFCITGDKYFYSSKSVMCEKGECFPINDYEKHFDQYLTEGSPAEFATLKGQSYLVGAMARLNNNMDLLTPESKKYALRIKHMKDNPFMNIPAQAIEILDAVNRAIIILSNIELKDESPVEYDVNPCACEGIAACEAPRGILFHKYAFDAKGYCTHADIVTPTTQNLRHIEEAIKEYISDMLDKRPDYVKKEIEKLIRAYDPCISCSTHFLEIEWEAD
ncbi:Ni/Fe hydrogenase subunit alpha [Candidatus Woesearchaeota archaeon]|nr:Ni/Fe hydrogenase subunit alpha [Candidatus Woesearchaeota archaeon]